MIDFKLRPVDLTNRGDLETAQLIEAAEGLARPWFWHQHSLENSHIQFRLIHMPTTVRAVGLVAFGPAYVDEQHTFGILGDFALLQLAIAPTHQRQGLGRAVAVQVLQSLALQHDCRRILVAIPADSLSAQGFFQHLGFLPIAQPHYDGDPMWAIATL